MNFYDKLFLWAIIAQTILLFGGVCNFVVITKNGGKMPALNINDMTQEITIHYFSYNDTTEVRYSYLADNFGYDTDEYQFRFSIGDVILFIGLVMYMTTLITYAKCHKKYVVTKKE